jgi:hypothetical protein
MGVDFLDFEFRIEKSLGLKFERWDTDRLPQRAPFDITVGELHAWVVALCNERGVTVPPSSWHRVQLELAKVVGKSPRLIRPETLIKRDLGFY